MNITTCANFARAIQQEISKWYEGDLCLLTYILPALRGPDYTSEVPTAEQEQIKLRTAGVVRRVLFGDNYPGTTASAMERFTILPDDTKHVSKHYLQHQLIAAAYLGLISDDQYLRCQFGVVGLSAEELSRMAEQ